MLAEQHYRTFCERMADFPFNVQVLSRFCTRAQQMRTLEGMEAGEVDIVVGTHRLVQKDIRFKDLGLLVIDEEQRFGVDAKEMLKRLRLEVDVLTMSATPIPRTLHLSLLGIRDISNLTTPPRDRQAIETRICRFDGELIRKAIVRELNRNGQIFFVHNRVHNIRLIADRLATIVPEASFGIAHGQMPEGQLEEAMVGFVTGKTDVLVCTTIVESGLDIPNANTIFIHQADKYGLADLHQLRGRVGRYKHRAYCYLLLEEGQSLSSTAARRLKAVEEFSELGAGFKIAMRDLEIRGAGNILGTEQSGHITSVGYELYCRLLDNAARHLKNEPVASRFTSPSICRFPRFCPARTFRWPGRKSRFTGNCRTFSRWRNWPSGRTSCVTGSVRCPERPSSLSRCASCKFARTIGGSTTSTSKDIATRSFATTIRRRWVNWRSDFRGVTGRRPPDGLSRLARAGIKRRRTGRGAEIGVAAGDDLVLYSAPFSSLSR